MKFRAALLLYYFVVDVVNFSRNDPNQSVVQMSWPLVSRVYVLGCYIIHKSWKENKKTMLHMTNRKKGKDEI